jgi:carbonic anhydrase
MTDPSRSSGQSPIDIDGAVFRPDLPELRFRYPGDPVAVRVCFTVVDGDPAEGGMEIVPQIVVTAPGSGAHVDVAGRRHELQSFHWHTPSEHQIGGRSAPLELHLVHRDEGGRLLVVGVLSLLGDHDEAIAPVFDLIEGFAPSDLTVGSSQCADCRLRLTRLLPASRTAHRYEGSLTTAPFTGGVDWILLTEPLHASADQVAAYMDLVSARIPAYQDPPLCRPNPPGNARVIQDRAGRTVVTDDPGAARGIAAV